MGEPESIFLQFISSLIILEWFFLKGRFLWPVQFLNEFQYTESTDLHENFTVCRRL